MPWTRRSGWTARQCGVNTPADGAGGPAPRGELVGGRASAGRPRRSRTTATPRCARQGAAVAPRCAPRVSVPPWAAPASTPSSPRKAATSPTVSIIACCMATRGRAAVRRGERREARGEQRRAPPAVAATGPEPDVVALEHGDPDGRVEADEVVRRPQPGVAGADHGDVDVEIAVERRAPSRARRRAASPPTSIRLRGRHPPILPPCCRRRRTCRRGGTPIRTAGRCGGTSTAAGGPTTRP